MSTTETIQTTSNKQLEESILNLIKGIQNDPEQANATFRAKSKLEEGFLSKTEIRDFSFLTDEPAELGGTNLGPNPVEYVLGAFAACQEIVVKAYATVLGIDVKSVRVEVNGDLDLQGFLNLTDARAGFTAVNYKTTIETTETDPVKLEQLETLAATRCPVLDIIRNATPINGSIAYV